MVKERRWGRFASVAFLLLGGFTTRTYLQLGSSKACGYCHLYEGDDSCKKLYHLGGQKAGAALIARTAPIPLDNYHSGTNLSFSTLSHYLPPLRAKNTID